MYHIHPIATKTARAYQQGGPDAYGNPPERAVSDGMGVPCRHCLKNVAKGADMLVLAHRPFEATHAYTETGPIFLCADTCTQAAPSATLPAMLTASHYILRGYNSDERIIYGTGAVIARDSIPTRVAELFANDAVVHIDLRSASNNCFLARIRRA